MADTAKTKKKSVGSSRAKAGLPAKAGRRRPPHLMSVRDRDGRRNWETVSRAVTPSKQKETA